MAWVEMSSTREISRGVIPPSVILRTISLVSPGLPMGRVSDVFRMATWSVAPWDAVVKTQMATSRVADGLQRYGVLRLPTAL